MILYILKNKSYFDENNISLGWQKKIISGISLKFSIWPQYVVGLNF